MKKTAMILLAAATLVSASAPLNAFAAEDSVTVRMIIRTDFDSDAVYSQDMTVTDADGDGTITADDALYLAHEEAYPGGAEAGLGEGFVWGRRGTFICEVHDGDQPHCSNPEECAAGTQPPMFLYDLHDGYTVLWYAQAISPDYYTFDIAFPHPEDPLYVIPVGTTLTGSVQFCAHDKKEKQPVPGVALTIGGEETGIRSDENGKFEITYDKPGQYNDYEGYAENGECIFEVSYGVSVLAVEPEKIGARVQTKIYLSEDAAEPVNGGIFTLYDTNDDGKCNEFDALNIANGLFFELRGHNLIDCPPLVKLEDGAEAEYLSELRVLDSAEAEAAGEDIAAQETTTAAEVTTTTTTTTTTTAATTTTTTAAAKAAAKPADAGMTGGVQTGDRMPVPALVFAGLAAAGAAAFCGRKKEQ